MSDGWAYRVDGSRVKITIPQESNPYPWSRNVNKIYFNSHTHSKSAIRPNSAKYNELQLFYKKYLSSLKTKPSDEIALMDNCLRLFQVFNQRKQQQLAAKIKETQQSLPVFQFKQQICQLLLTHHVILIAADTGAGKSTQVPQFLMDAGYTKISVTQPRRIACYSLAKRVEYEYSSVNHVDGTGLVGYKVRFDGNRNRNTKVLFLTEGVLLRQFASDPLLLNYNIIILDEVHERSLTSDFLLAILKRVLISRNKNPDPDIPPLKLILMSATINIQLFTNFFNNSPVVEVPGRVFPVKITYLPVAKEDHNLVDEKICRDRLKDSGGKVSIESKQGKIKTEDYLNILERIDQTTSSSERGDVLIFLSGHMEIANVAEELRNYANFTKKWIILQLHSSLSVSDQEKVFNSPPPGIRKCIVSTNIAETSVTIDGIRFVVDSGKVKEMGFDPKVGLSRLSEFWISQSSAKQRSGRAGRTGPGECFRLYSENEFNHFMDFPIPEILRSPLDAILLQILAYNLEPADPRNFEFLERPSETNMDFSLSRLINLNALSETTTAWQQSKTFNLTPLGRILSVLPLDVVLGKMLIMGSFSDLLIDPVVVAASALSVQNPFIRIDESKTDIIRNRQELLSEHGDPFTLLNLVSEWIKIKVEGATSSRNWCKRRGIEEQRCYELVKLKTQFERILKQYLSPTIPSESLKRSTDEIEEDWNDPEFKKRRYQQHLLKKQKRSGNGNVKKVLDFEAEQGVEEEQLDDDNVAVEDVTELNVNELEFSLKHGSNPNDLLNKFSDVNTLSSRELNLLKLILCSGLYPNFAIADEHNAMKKLSEQVFHTRHKKFLFMHPGSVFYTRPELVYPKIEDAPVTKTTGRETLETLHTNKKSTELLCFLELLETTKPYLTNVFRIPAMEFCMIFGKSIYVSPNLVDIVIDDWLHLKFPDGCEDVLRLVCRLRKGWDRVLDDNLKIINSNISIGESKESETQVGEKEVPFSFFGKAISNDDPHIISVQEELRKKDQRKIEFDKQKVQKDQTKALKFLPAFFKEIRNEYFDESIEYFNDDIMEGLADFMEMYFNVTVERLKVVNVDKLFGYDIYARSVESCSIEVVPSYLRFFVDDVEGFSNARKN